MISTPSIPALTDPQLIDAALAQINTKLTTELSWLDAAFGKADRLEEVVDNRKRTYPAIYRGEGLEYLKLIPDSHIGNFCFFDIMDESKSEWVGRSHDQFVYDFGLVFWFDFRDIYPNDHQSRTHRNVIAQVYRTIKEMRLTGTNVSIDRQFERPENVYVGFNYVYSDPQYTDQVRTQLETGDKFFMRPYGCFRLEGQIRCRESSTVC